MLTQTLPPSPACYAAQWPTFTATVNNTARCFYSANALFFITDLLGHHDIPSFLPPTSPLLTHPAAWGAALLYHMRNNKWASRCFVHACILQGTCCKSLRRTLTRLWTFAEFQKMFILFFTGEKLLTVLVADCCFDTLGNNTIFAMMQIRLESAINMRRYHVRRLCIPL